MPKKSAKSKGTSKPAGGKRQAGGGGGRRRAADGQGPEKLTLRVYNAGFGDCFLLTFHYPGFRRRVLIDFGTGAAPKNADDDYMLRIARDIRDQCTAPGGGAKLDAVVATHRHRDHISGFSTEGDGTGTIIASLKPDLVVQPWTEDPEAQPDASAPASTAYTGGRPDPKAFVAGLRAMQAVAEAAVMESAGPHLGLGVRAAAQMGFLGEVNLANRPAIDNLMEMGRRQEPGWQARATYVHCGSESGLEGLLPGVKVHVLGPPTLEQTDRIRQQRSSDPDEFWQLCAFWGFQAAAGASALTGALLFPDAAVYPDEETPPAVRWFVSRAQRIRGDQLLELVRALDKAMNNTSVILLFEAGGTKLLFPGDAQIENWSYALEQPEYQELLRDVRVYKAGHHGSRNATPRSLWELFTRKQEQEAPGRLTTVLSTRSGKHGSTHSRTEVPRATLVAELKRQSDYFSTQDLPKSALYRDFEFTLRG